MTKNSFLKFLTFFILITCPLSAAEDDPKEVKGGLRGKLTTAQNKTQDLLGNAPKLFASHITLLLKAQYHPGKEETEPTSIIPGIIAKIKSTRLVIDNLIRATHEDYLTRKTSFAQINIKDVRVHSKVTGIPKEVLDDDYEAGTVLQAQETDPDARGKLIRYEFIFNSKPLTYLFGSSTIVAGVPISVTFTEKPIERKLKGLLEQNEKEKEARRLKALRLSEFSPDEEDNTHEEDSAEEDSSKDQPSLPLSSSPKLSDSPQIKSPKFEASDPSSKDSKKVGQSDKLRGKLIAQQAKTQIEVGSLLPLIDSDQLQAMLQAFSKLSPYVTDFREISPGIFGSIKIQTLDSIRKATSKDFIVDKVEYKYVDTSIPLLVHNQIYAQFVEVVLPGYKGYTLDRLQVLHPGTIAFLAKYAIYDKSKPSTPLKFPPEARTIKYSLANTIIEFIMSINVLPESERIGRTVQLGILEEEEEESDSSLISDQAPPSLDDLKLAAKTLKLLDASAPQASLGKEKDAPSPSPLSASSIAVKRGKEMPVLGKKESEERKDTPFPSPSSAPVPASKKPIDFRSDKSSQGGLRKKLAVAQSVESKRPNEITYGQLQKMLQARSSPFETTYVEIAPGLLGCIKCQSLDELARAVSFDYLTAKASFNQVDVTPANMRVHELINCPYIREEHCEGGTLASQYSVSKEILSMYNVFYDEAPLTYPTDLKNLGSAPIYFFTSLKFLSADAKK